MHFPLPWKISEHNYLGNKLGADKQNCSLPHIHIGISYKWATYKLQHIVRQLTLHFRRDELAASIERLERCIEDVDQWMSANRLMLNVDKTEWLLVGLRRTLSSLDITRPVLQLGGNIVAASDHVRLLGVDIVSALNGM